jgi:RHH-type proline utilization regulon transcriptional repressor/proline dehydrogenase/delta 1-pyrroline-5-carboxylate dehydrogenase
LSDEISDYVATLSHDLDLDLNTLTAAAGSYTYWRNKEFSIEHDSSQLLGESNHFRYRRLHRILVRGDAMNDLELALVQLVGRLLNTTIEISLSEERQGIDACIETETQLCNRLESQGDVYSSLRIPEASDDLRKVANEECIQLIDWAVLSNGRIELLHYHREQSVSETTHRYGNIIPEPHECV